MLRKLLCLTLVIFITSSFAQNNKFFPDEDLTSVGAYYYPEHWDESQWDRDLKKIADMGFEFTHFAEFAWAQLEPQEGVFDFAWLDRAVALADKHGLKVIMCTSTATPPVWLVRKHPDVLIQNENGVQVDHGSRQHASFSNEYYRAYSQVLIEKLAEKYGQDERIMGWQIDNEPRRATDYGEDVQNRFRAWLKNKYKTIDALNQAWGTNFWSVIYSDFSEINIPRHSQWGMNLYQLLDHTRFGDEETASFLNEQAKTIRKHASDKQWITSNYIPMYHVRYIGASKEFDFVSYTRYMVYGQDKGIGPQGYRVGEYTRIGLANDYFRPLSPLYGVMELQPGQVNWGRINSQPLPGAVRLWLWHVFAGGSKFTCSYRYRAPIYGYEQYHYGIVGPDGVTPTPGGLEYQQFIEEIKLLRSERSGSDVPEEYLNRKTGILYDPDNTVAIDQNKQSNEWNTFEHVRKYYKALKAFGAPVDFIRDTTVFSIYPVIVVPAYQQISKNLIEKLKSYANEGGQLILSCRTGHQNLQGHLWQEKYGAPMYDLIGSEIEFYDLLMPHTPGKIQMDSEEFSWVTWGEILNPEKKTETWATYGSEFYKGKSAVTHRKLGKGTVTYVGVDSESGTLEQKVLTKAFGNAGIPIEDYPEGIIVEYRDGFGIAMNYGDKPYEMSLPEGANILIGSSILSTAEVLVWAVP